MANCATCTHWPPFRAPALLECMRSGDHDHDLRRHKATRPSNLPLMIVRAMLLRICSVNTSQPAAAAELPQMAAEIYPKSSAAAVSLSQHQHSSDRTATSTIRLVSSSSIHRVHSLPPPSPPPLLLVVAASPLRLSLCLSATPPATGANTAAEPGTDCTSRRRVDDDDTARRGGEPDQPPTKRGTHRQGCTTDDTRFTVPSVCARPARSCRVAARRSASRSRSAR